ncbi:MAG: bile acid:sodium symporter family protein, partial [Sutterellaceae bacterium]|nr:bile acid:sodium symporter family protein [Sutterellaceae bacterium]
LLGLVMFGMGLTLSLNDFKLVLKSPRDVFIGIIAQFVIMPVVAYGLCIAMQLPPEIAVGVILVGCCPGGTASNVMTFLARGDVALSVTITSCTTLLAPIVTPALIYIFAHQWIDIDPLSMFWSICQIVLIPIALGAGVHTLLGSKRLQVATTALPLVSVVAIVLIVCAVVAVSQPRIATTGPLVFAVVVLHNGIGLLLGYLVAKMLGMSIPRRKCLSIEVGMQNSGLGVALAAVHFAAMPLATLPSAIFSFWHNVSGPIVATLYNRFKNEDDV